MPASSRVDEALASNLPRSLGRNEKRALLQRAAAAEHVLLLLDYDGTLVPFAARPELARPDAALIELLRALAAAPRFEVHVVSGRPRQNLEDWLGALPLGLHAEHGLWSRLCGGDWRLAATVESSWQARALSVLEQFVSCTPGSFIEQKTASLAWHYRRCDPESGERQARELKLDLAHALGNAPVAVLAGNKVVELQPRGVHKGTVTAAVCGAAPGAFVIAAGDDETDENLFAALPRGAVSLHVGSRPSKAHYNLRHHRAVRRLLQALADSASAV
ncbi:MAG: trehalose-phosphatase [Candidatus Riflebacteria bacterium]|nr:trehalose-phosphatase [Candidatus Riflebacteria bacterium]